MKKETMGDLIRNRRSEKALSLRDLARLAKVSHGFLYDVEQGKRFPSAEILAQIAAALNMPVDAFTAFDHRQLVKSLQKLLANEPALTKTLSDLVRDVNTGSLTVDDLVARLTGATGGQSPSLPAS